MFFLLSMKELFVNIITKPHDVIQKCFLSISFFLFPCSKGQPVSVYLDTIQMALVKTNYIGIQKDEMVRTFIK